METVMDALPQLGSLVHDSGFTLGWLILIASLFALSLVLSGRELLGWYLKIPQLQAEIRELKTMVARLENSKTETALTRPAPKTESLRVEPLLDVQPLELPLASPLSSKRDAAKPSFTLNH